MDTVTFSYGKRAIFPKVKEIKRLRGGVAVYAAQASVQIDAEIGEKGRFRMKTSSILEGIIRAVFFIKTVALLLKYLPCYGPFT
jgi:hypothetical protein